MDRQTEPIIYSDETLFFETVRKMWSGVFAGAGHGSKGFSLLPVREKKNNNSNNININNNKKIYDGNPRQLTFYFKPGFLEGSRLGQDTKPRKIA